MNKDEYKTENPEYTIDLIELLSELDPSGNDEYLDFMIKTTKDWVKYITEEMKEKTFKDMIDILSEFNEMKKEGIITEDVNDYVGNGKALKALIDSKKVDG